jgi:hypothetical protein
MSVSRLSLFLVPIAVLSLAVSSRAGTATVTGVAQIYLRMGPGTTYSPNGVVAEGQAVTTIEQVGNWHRVETLDGRTGFIYSGYLSFAPSPAVPSPAAKVAAGAETPFSGPVARPAEPVAPAAGASPPAESNGYSWQDELASLKAEVARLRSEVDGPDTSPHRTPASLAALTLPTRAPVEISTNSPEASNLRTVGIAVFFLVVGWIFGAGFARRRTRSQRGRLRF